MKITFSSSFLKITLFFISLMLLQTILIAQNDNATKSVTVTTETHTWYAAPWVWVAGGVILLILLISLFRRSSNKTTTTHTERVIVTKNGDKT